MKTVAVMPAYNEEKRIRRALLEVAPHVDLIIVVDDGSADATHANATGMNGVVALRHGVNRGQGAALKTGTDAALMAGADLIVHIDADGQHNPADIDSLKRVLIERRADIVFGSRFLGVESVGMPAARRLLLQAAKQFNTFALGIPRSVTDPQSGFRVMNRRAAEAIPFSQDRMAHCSEILRLVTRSDLKWIEAPVQIRYTDETLSKGQKPADALKIVWQLIVGAFH